MDRAELRKLFMNMYSGNTNAWGAISKRFKREDLQGKKKLKRESESFPAFDSLIKASEKTVKQNQNKQDWNVSKPQSIRINQKTFGQMEKLKGGNRTPETVRHVNSAAVDSINYNPETKDLTVVYTDSPKEYLYPEVPKRVVQAFMMAPSKGAFANKVISKYSDYSNPRVQEKIREGN